MNQLDEDREAIWGTLYAQYLENSEKLWDEIVAAGDGLSGAEVAMALAGNEEDRASRADMLLKLIEERVQEAARGKADDETDAVYRAQRRRGWNLLRGKDREDAEDLA